MGHAEERPRGGGGGWCSGQAWSPPPPLAVALKLSSPSPFASPCPGPLDPNNCAIYSRTHQRGLSCSRSKIFQVVMKWVSSRVSRKDRWLAQGFRGSLCGVFWGISKPYVGKSRAKLSQGGETGVRPLVEKIPWRRARQPTLAFWPGESHGQRSLAGHSPRGHKESDTTEATEHARTF